MTRAFARRQIFKPNVVTLNNVSSVVSIAAVIAVVIEKVWFS